MFSSLFSRVIAVAAAVTVLYGGAVSVAEAQQGYREGYGDVGIRAGAFMVMPEASITETYNDNIYATDVGTTDDFITTLAASVAAQSTWSRHALNLNAGVSQLLYADSSDEDRFEWNVGADGRVDITGDTSISGGVTYAVLSEDRDGPNAVANAEEPTEYAIFAVDAQLDHRFNRVTTRLGAGYAEYDYDDVPLIGGGVLAQDSRDYEMFEQLARVGYDVSPDTNVYIQGSLNQRKYDQQPPVAAVNRDSDGYAAVVGADFRVTNLIDGGVFAGYQSQNYDNPGFSDTDGLSYGADLDWFVTPLTTVRLEAAATIQETNAAGASGFLDQSVGLSVEHELLRNLLLGAGASFANLDYEGIARTDDVVSAGLSADYAINRNFTIGLGYDYTERDSSAPGLDFSRNEFGLRLEARL